MPLTSYVEYVLGEIKILPIYSDPTEEDSDGDGLYDEEEYYLATDPLNKDSDNDGPSDGKEVDLWFDPLASNPDGDSYSDYAEWNNKTSPFVYNMTAKESKEAFAKGALLGDFETADSIEVLLGQIVFSFVPFVADLRDLVANVFVNHEGWATLLNAGGFALDLTGVGGVARDGAKAVSRLGSFVTEYADDVPKVVEAIVQGTKHFPAGDEVVPMLAKILPVGAFDDMLRSLKSGEAITKADYDKLCDVFKIAGKSTDEVVEATKFKSFRALKKYLGDPGEGKHWHHIVEQCQISKSGFDVGDINKVDNVIAVDAGTHAKITGYYNTSTFEFTNGLKVRDWLAGKSYEEQYQFGMDVLRMFEVIE